MRGQHGFRASLLLIAGLSLLTASCSDSGRPPPPALNGPDQNESAAKDSVPTDVPLLADEEREYIWDLEHHGNLLVKFGLKPMAEALIRADRTSLLNLIATKFSGQTLGNPHEVHMRSEFGEAVRLEDSGSASQTLTAEAFADQLLALRAPFGRAPKASFSLMTLSPIQRGDLEGEWLGTSMLRMWGETQPDQPREVTAFMSFRVAKPVRERLAGGHWLSSCSITQTLVAHANRYLMRESAKERGIDVDALYDTWKEHDKDKKPSSAIGGVYLCDFNRDGYMDVLITDAQRFVLYQGLPDGKFKDVTLAMGLPAIPMAFTPSSHIAAFADLDGDGWEDLILGGQVYRNMEGKRFVHQPIQPAIPMDALDVAVADYDCDGKVDLYLLRPSEPSSGSWLSGRAGKPRSNRLWRNLGNWKFEDVTESCGGVDGGGRSTFTALWLDANNDGLPDLYVTNEFGDGILYVNQGNGKFREQPIVSQPTDFGTMGAAVGDIDNDGHIDIYCANMYSKAGARVMSNMRSDAYPHEIMSRMRRFIAGSQLHRNLGNLRFEQMGPKWQLAGVGWAYGPALVDLDNDGFLDIFATCGYVSRDRSEPDG
jgi:hypothetical protein